jgi:hypothetical protein
MIAKPNYDKMIKQKENAKWFSFSLAMFFGGATFFSMYYLYTLLFGFATIVFIIEGFSMDTEKMVWEIKKELGEKK